MDKLTPEIVLGFLQNTDGRIHLREIRAAVDISLPENKSDLYVIMHRLVERGQARSLGGGYYRFIKRDIKPASWWDGGESQKLDLTWPYDIETYESFGFEEHLNIYAGDVIVIAGVTNRGKTCFILNFLVNNMDKHECVLLSSEFNNIQIHTID